jgi:hypothetical protein
MKTLGVCDDNLRLPLVKVTQETKLKINEQLDLIALQTV